ncbi:MAG TPA: glutamine-hydrolyzing GMP synthase [Candidatus Woesebacteria bacterium]|nr:glutamine-hydrolyzing GMP synthase [Candidatus Woesebacteria bacterium]
MKKLLILDFGSQYTHLIKSILQKSGYYSEILAADVTIDVLEQTKYEGLILSGGASSVNNSEINFDYEFLNLGLPILGICYGHQLIASHFGAKVKGASHEYGETSITINNDTDILSGLNNTNVWMSHGDSVISLPIGAEVMAYTNKDPYTALLYRDKNIRTIQFHPEVTHTQNGESVLINFAKVICRMSPSSAWTPSAFIEEYKQIYRDSNLEGKKLVLGLSGGVDSMTLAAFMRTFVNRDNFLCIYVDSGLMQTETKQEVIEFCKQYDIALETVEAEERFFKILSGIDDPREKGKVIGHEFIRIFDEIA